MTLLRTYTLPTWLRLSFLAAIPLIAVGMLALGLWQLSRLQERRALNAQIRSRLDQPAIALNSATLPDDLQTLDYRPVHVRGTFDVSQEIVWKNQALNGAPGVHVITPLRLAGSEMAVLVDRGWIPYTEAEPEARAAYPPPSGEVDVSGMIRIPARRTSSLSPADPPLGPERPRLDAWFWMDVTQIQAQVPYPFLPILIVQAPDSKAVELPVRSYDLQLDEGPHLTYAIQWFSFAAIAILGPLIYWRQSRRQP